MFQFIKNLFSTKPPLVLKSIEPAMTFESAKTVEGQSIFVIGDIHGCIDLLEEKVVKIRQKMAESEPQINQRFHVVFLGDYIDRGDHSKHVIETLMALKVENCEFHFLMGNHEDILLKFLSEPRKYFKVWMAIGGVATLSSFGIYNLDDVEAVKQSLIRAMGMKMISFLNDLETSYQNGDYFFCHAVPRAGIPLLEQSKKTLINNRTEANPVYEQIVVHGHVSGNEVKYSGSKINIDTGAYATENLTCLLVYNHNQIVL